MCKTFGWTLYELREQPTDDLLAMWQVLNIYEERKSQISNKSQ